MNVYTIPEVKHYLNDLITILYEEGYFTQVSHPLPEHIAQENDFV